MVAWMGTRSPTFHPISLGDGASHDGAGAIRRKRLQLVFRHDELRIEREELLRHHGRLHEEILGILIDTTEPSLVGYLYDARHPRDAGLVAYRQQLDNRDLVPEHQTIGAGQLDAHAEGYINGGDVPEE